MLVGEQRPGGGAALIDGQPLATLSPAMLAERRAVLEQSPTLSGGFTVAELVRLGAEAVPRSPAEPGTLVARALAATGTTGHADRPTDRLSGGERSRAHLARVLAQLWAGQAAGHRGWLLLDEPTASLDLAHQVAVMRTARAAADAGAGVLCVLHDLIHLLRGPKAEDHTLYASHIDWESEAHVVDWTKSEHFREAHARAGDHKVHYLGHPQFEGFTPVEGA